MTSFLRALAAGFADGTVIGDHVHGWGQLVYAARGAIHVEAAGQAWLIPPARAVWLPPHTPHRLRMRGATWLRTLYLPPGQCGALPVVPRGIAVSPLLRELIVELARAGHLAAADPRRSLGEALVILIAAAAPLPLALTLPTDPRAARVAAAILADPADDRSLAVLAAAAGASLRTVQRRFVAETGTALADWRQTARLLAAAAALVDGASVTGAAFAAGYGGSSAFAAAFRRKLGMTPAAFRRVGS